MMSSSSFLVVSLGFSMYSITSTANSDILMSFPTWSPFVSFYSLIAMIRTSKTMLNKTGEIGHPSLIPVAERPADKLMGVPLDGICCFYI